MVTRRVQRLNQQLRREISEVLRWDVKDPRVGPATVTRVEASSDLSHAKVWVMVMASDQAERQDALDGLKAAAVFVRRALTERMDIRKVPELHFLPDRSMEHAARIEAILEEVLPAEDEAEAQADGEADQAESALDGDVVGGEDGEERGG